LIEVINAVLNLPFGAVLRCTFLKDIVHACYWLNFLVRVKTGLEEGRIRYVTEQSARNMKRRPNFSGKPKTAHWRNCGCYGKAGTQTRRRHKRIIHYACPISRQTCLSWSSVA